MKDAGRMDDGHKSMIIEQIKVGIMDVFCYLLGDERAKEGVLVDPSSDFDRINARIKAHGFNICRIINTHGHIDHISGNRYYVKMTGAHVTIHQDDYFFLNRRVNRFVEFIKGGRAVEHEIEFVGHDDTIYIGESGIRVIHTPGHSPGSICLYFDGNLLTGDTLFTEGMGRTDFFGGNHETLLDSIKNRILTLPDDTVIWPGHHYGRFPVSTVREQKRYYL